VPRAEFIAGAAAAVSDLGLRRRRNEDAVAMTVAGDGVVVALCDGVASTANAHHASDRASIAALRSLERGHRRWARACPSCWAQRSGAPRKRSAPSATMTRREESCRRRPPWWPPSPRRARWRWATSATVGPIGLSASAQRRLTVDDSWAEELVAEGTPREGGVRRSRGAHHHPVARPRRHLGRAHDHDVRVPRTGAARALQRWLWNYFEQAERLAPQLGLTRAPRHSSSPTASSTPHSPKVATTT